MLGAYDDVNAGRGGRGGVGALDTLAPVVSRHPQIVAEIQKLQDKQSSRTSAVLVLFASLAMFIGLGGAAGSRSGGSAFSLTNLFILVPVLLFHEAGHWVAMRAFGYRNLRMFFIPFLGAAVSGRNYN